METQIKEAPAGEESLIKEIRPGDAHFTMLENGYLSVKIDDKEHNKVILKRLLPFTYPDKYISVTVDETELGIIKDLSLFVEEQVRLINRQLDFYYYTPSIEKIISAKEKMGYLYIEATVNGVSKRFCVSDFTKNIVFVNDDIFITDIEGNRYLIPNASGFDSASMQKIDMFL